MVRKGYYIITIFFLLLVSCLDKSGGTGHSTLKKTVPGRDSLRSFIKQQTAQYRAFCSAGKNEEGLACLQRICLLSPYCSQPDSLTAAYRSAMLTYAFELDNREQYFQAEDILQGLLSKPELPWLNRFHPADAATILGNIYTRYGDYKKALLWLHQAGVGYKLEKDTLYFVKAMNNEAIALMELKQYQPAKELLAIAAAWKTPQPESRFLNYWLLAAVNLKLQLAAQANACADTARRILPTTGPGFQTCTSLLMELRAELLKQEGRFFAAINMLKAAFNSNVAVDDRYRLSREAGKLLDKLASCYLDAGFPDSALSYSHKALCSVIRLDTAAVLTIPSSSQLYAENTIQEVLTTKAHALEALYQQRGDTNYLITAVQCYALGFEVERKLMQYFSYDESKMLLLDESRMQTQRAISLCYRLMELTHNSGWAEKAFRFSEMNKAFVLLESVRRNLAANSDLTTDTLYSKTQSLQLQLAFTERSLQEAETDSAKNKITDQKNKLENELLTAKTAFAHLHRDEEGLTDRDDSISGVRLGEQLLNEQRVLVEFFSGDSGTFSFVLSREQPLIFSKLPASLNQSVDSLLLFFQEPAAIASNPARYEQLAFRVYRELPFDALPATIKELIIIPDGRLRFLPFDALITRRGTDIDLRQANWFINRFNAVYGYSAAILLQQNKHPAAGGGQVSVFAPVFHFGQRDLPPLVYTRMEADAITRQTHSRLFIESDASLFNFREQFSNTAILHIATHAFADTSGKKEPRIELADSSLTLSELYALHTNASLVVLSACETGMGALSSSEGPLSLARGFYYAGARNVITSYWAVDDKSTAQLFTSFYSNLPGHSSAAALYQAKRSYLKNARGAYASPFYWAGFVHFGADSPVVTGPSARWWWLMLLLLPLFLLLQRLYARA